jgi:hypothetical protein
VGSVLRGALSNSIMSHEELPVTHPRKRFMKSQKTIIKDESFVKSLIEDEALSSSDCEIFEPVKNTPEVIVVSSDENAEEEEEDDDEGDKRNDHSGDEKWEDSKLKKGKNKIKVGKVSIEAFCVDVEGESSRAQKEDRKPNTSSEAEENIKIRIRKLLQVGMHPGTPNEEAERSLKMAQNLLQRHNLEEIEVMNAGGLDGNTRMKGGMKVVELRSKTGTTPKNAEWMTTLAKAAATCFDCCRFHQRRGDKFNHVFYGVATNAEMAAFAFSSSMNRVTQMTAAYTGVEGIQNPNMLVARANYRNGLVFGLNEAVKEDQKARVLAAQEQDRLRKAEIQARRELKLEKARAEQSVIDAAAAAAGLDAKELWRSADATYSDDDDGVDEAEGARLWQAKSERQSLKSDRTEMQALTVLQVKCKDIAKEVLKNANIKLSKRKRPPLISHAQFDANSYRQGQADAKEIKIKQKGISDTAVVVKKPKKCDSKY